MKPHRRRRHRHRRCRSRADAGVALPTELVLEILSRATPSTAVRCATTCRPWFRLVSHRSFARRASRPRRALLLGFFAFDHTEDDEQATLPPRFVGGSGGGWRCPCVPRLDDDPRCRDMQPVLSRNGYLVLSRADVVAGWPTTIRYCVCNPSTGLRHFLPPFRVQDGVGFWEYGCALLTGRDLSSCDASSFELLVAGIHGEERELWVDSFSSRTMTWTTSTRRLEIPCRRIAMVDEQERQYGSHLGNCWDCDTLRMHPKNLPAVLDDGVIHWQCSCHNGARVVLALDVRAWDVELIDLPRVSHCSGTYWDLGLVLGSRSDGVLCALGLAARNGLVLETWSTLKRRVDGAIGRGGRTWHRSGDIDLRRAISGCNGGGNDDDVGGDIGDVKLLWYCEKSNVLVFNTVALGNFALDLETERAEALGEIMHCRSDFCARNACVWWRASPYEIDCPPAWITPT